MGLQKGEFSSLISKWCFVCHLTHFLFSPPAISTLPTPSYFSLSLISTPHNQSSNSWPDFAQFHRVLIDCIVNFGRFDGVFRRQEAFTSRCNKSDIGSRRSSTSSCNHCWKQWALMIMGNHSLWDWISLGLNSASKASRTEVGSVRQR